MNPNDEFKEMIDLMKLKDHFTLTVETMPVYFEPVFHDPKEFDDYEECENKPKLPTGDYKITTKENAYETFQQEMSRESVKAASDFDIIYNRELSKYLKKFTTSNEPGFIEYEVNKITELVKSVESLSKIQGNYTFRTAIDYLAFLEQKIKTVGIVDPIDKRQRAVEKHFIDYFLQYRETLPDKLKNEFKTEKGKNIRLVIDVLKKVEIISIESRGNMRYFNAMKKYFGREIGSYQSIFNYKRYGDEIEYQAIYIRIHALLGC